VVRYAWAYDDAHLGFISPVDDSRNWHGSVKSKKIKIFVAPAQGARLNVQVLNRAVQPAQPIDQVVVKLFKGDLLDLETTWADEALAIGTTNSNGWAWQTGSLCIQKDAYTAIAKYGDIYKAAYFSPEADWWATNCGGYVEEQIFFGGPSVSQFSVFAINSLWLRSKANVDGNVGVQDVAKEPMLKDVEVYIGENAKVDFEYSVYGNRVTIRSGASVDNVYYNELDNSGVIHGDEVTPVSLPLWDALPIFEQADNSLYSTNKKDDLTISLQKPPPLLLKSSASNKYCNLTLESHAVAYLDGGDYHLNSLTLGSNASLICLKPTRIMIAERIYPGTKAYLGPYLTLPPDYNQEKYPEITAKDIVLYVAGINGKKGTLKENPKAVSFGEGTQVSANIYAPYGTVLINEGCNINGGIIAKDVEVGSKTMVTLDSAFE
jgi:hypothetical protein